LSLGEWSELRHTDLQLEQLLSHFPEDGSVDVNVAAEEKMVAPLLNQPSGDEVMLRRMSRWATLASSRCAALVGGTEKSVAIPGRVGSPGGDHKLQLWSYRPVDEYLLKYFE
jgi:hypothetical protein